MNAATEKTHAHGGSEDRRCLPPAYVDKGIARGVPGSPPTYVGMCHIFCDSVEIFQAGFGPHAGEIMADIANYTDLSPVIQISDVVVA